MAMCEDGKKIFRKEAAKRDQFTWTTVQALIKNNQSAHSVKGFVTDATEKSPIANANVVVLDSDGLPIEGKEELTAVDGAYNLKGLKNGDYTLQVEAEGYNPAEVPFVIEGKPIDLDVELSAVVEA